MEKQTSWLTGKIALVTGAGKRLGRAVSLALAENGANIVLHYRGSRDEAMDVAEKIREMGVKAWTIQADLDNPDEAEELLPAAVEMSGPIQILINNASIFTKSHLMDFDLKDFSDNIQVNAISPLLMARELAGQCQDGAIVNFLDTRITEYDKDHAAYHLSKRMLFTLTRMMALEFAPAIRVNAIAPGLILPPPGQDVSYLEALALTNPLNRIGNPGEITSALLFLLKSQFITGQVIFVDGGYHLKGYFYG